MWPDAIATARMRLVFAGTMDGQQVRTTFNYQLSKVTGTTKPINVLVDAFFLDAQWTALMAAWKAATPSDYKHDYTTWQWSQGGDTFLQQRKTVNVNGALDPAQTANLQATIVRRGQLAERRGVGGIRVPANNGVGMVVNGELTQTYKNFLQPLADLMDDIIIVTVDGTGSFEFTPGTYYRTGPGTYSFSATFATFIQPELRVIRRRTSRLGI